MSSLNSRLISEPGWWDRHIVPRLIGCACAQPQIMKARSHLVPQASGNVLEVGCGGGINMEFYEAAKIEQFAGVDPSLALLDKSKAAAQARGIDADIRGGVGEALPFGDGEFDTVVCTFTLCSVDCPQQVVAEMRRVLRPGGQVLFLEHGSAPDESVRRWQRRIEPVWKRVGGNCHLTRPVTRTYEAMSLCVERMGERYMPKTPRPFGWIEWGAARI